MKKLSCNLEKQHFQVLQPNYLLIFQVSYNLKICCRERHTKSSKAQVVQSSAKHVQNPFEVLIFPNSFNEVDYGSEKKKMAILLMKQVLRKTLVVS